MVLGFLHAVRDEDYVRAATHLDLRGVPPAAREARGPRLAWELTVILDTVGWPDFDTLSDAPLGDPDDGLPGRQDRLTEFTTDSRRQELLLAQVPAVSGARRWLVSQGTIASIPELYRAVGGSPFGDWLPRWFSTRSFLGVRPWQWIGLAILLVGSALVAWILTTVLSHLLDRPVDRGRLLKAPLVMTLRAPLVLTIWVGLCVMGAAFLGLGTVTQTRITRIATAVVIVALAWGCQRLVDRLRAVAQVRLAQRGQGDAIVHLPTVARVTKILLAGVATLFVLQNLGVNITGVVAGLGIGGIALALGAQRTLENLFGGIMLLVDKPVGIGDFCRFGEQVGTVEEVGLRSTRIRTLDRTVVSMPNAEFATLPLENFSRRDRIRFTTVVGLRYETTPDQLRWVLVETKRLLLAHPKVASDPARIRLIGLGAYSLDLELFAYVLTTSYDEFLAVREDLLLRLMDIVAASGTSFAYPSHTVYARRDPGVDEAQRHAAEERVRHWRAEGKLWLPEVPGDYARAIEGTLDYPPRGSATRERPINGKVG